MTWTGADRKVYDDLLQRAYRLRSEPGDPLRISQEEYKALRRNCNNDEFSKWMLDNGIAHEATFAGRHVLATITMSELERIVLHLSNSRPTRWFKWLNYPNNPQLMGIAWITKTPDDERFLYEALQEQGFKYDPQFGCFTIERMETKTE